MDQMPKNTTILITLRAIRISAAEMFFRNSVECDSMWLHLRETAVNIDSRTMFVLLKMCHCGPK